MKSLLRKIESILNDYSVKKKLLITFIFCVLLPLIVTDSIILSILITTEKNEQSYKMQNVADTLRYDLEYTFDEAAKVVNDIYVSRPLYEFLDTKYKDGYDYFVASREVIKGNAIVILGGYNMTNLVIYGDNDTIVNGGRFYQLEKAKDSIWYHEFEESARNTTLSFYYTDDIASTTYRNISLVRRLDCYGKNGGEKLARLDLNYSVLARRWTSMNYGYDIMLCDGDNIIFTNMGNNAIKEPFQKLTGKEPVSYRSSVNLYGKEMDILIMRSRSSVIGALSKNIPLVFFLLIINLILPSAMMSLINRSFTNRLHILGRALNGVEGEDLQEIDFIEGKDEIGILMQNYNQMVERINDLIMIEYKGRLERQEVEFAKQKAELLALHSQINPHFLFNVLETIRMHSLINGENETAGMIEKLAILERQNINWAQDIIKLKDEMHFVEAYLELQSFRFGERLRYDIDLPKECEEYYVPKLFLTTFVENSCVHGMEEKSSVCWLYVRVSLQGKMLHFEIEDTGCGMNEDEVREMNHRMKNSNINDLKANKHVGISNACLRLKMFSKGHADFMLESEEGVGTYITINVDTEYLNNERGDKTNVDESYAG